MARFQLVLLLVAVCNLSSVTSDVNDGLGSEHNPSDERLEKLHSTELTGETHPKRKQNGLMVDTHHEDIHDHIAEFIENFNLSSKLGSKASKRSRTEVVNVVVPDGEAAGGNVTSVNLCCDHDQIFNPAVMMCQPSGDTVRLVFHDEAGNSIKGVHYTPVVGMPNCSLYNLSPSMNGLDDHFTITTEGVLIAGNPSTRLDSPPHHVAPGKYCVLFPDPEIMEALVCFPDGQVQTVSTTYGRDFQRSVYPACLLVGSLFLALTLLVYCLVPELREESMAKSFMCSIAMLALAQVLMVTGKWGIDSLIHTPACIAIGSLTHFSFLSAFLWLNVISIMVLRALWRTGPHNPSSRCLSPMCYRALYGFGVAGVVAVAALVRDLVPALQGSVLPRPRFAKVSCWFSKSNALVVYLLGPISVLLLANLICFCIAACKMFTLNKHSDRSKLHFSQYMKLFVLMGLSWIFEVISFFVNAATDEGSWLTYLWVFFDMVNILQGVLIFVLFVCRKSVLRHLAVKLCGSAGCLADDENDRDDGAPCTTVV